MGGSERNPFVGPRPIQEGEALHGRGVEVRQLHNRLHAHRIVVLHSPSGAGKSSLVHAGLIPRLSADGFDVWRPIRVNLDPQGLEGVPEGTNRYLLSVMVSLEEEVPASHRRSPAVLAGLSLGDYLASRPRRKRYAGRPVVLVFDQLEEVLTVAPLAIAAKQELFTEVGKALDVEGYWALFIVRDDYLAAFAPYRERIPTQLSNTFRLDFLGLAGAREAAEQLAREGGRSFPAVDRLIHDLSMVQVQQRDGSFVAEQGPSVEPVLLQVVCRRLWEAMPKDDRSIDEEDVERYGGVSEAVAGYYADAVRTVAGGDPAAERAIREWVGGKLIFGGIRSQVRQDVGKSAGLDNALIDRLLDSYLVRTEHRAGVNWYELSHDRLVEPVERDNQAWEQEHLHPLQVQARLWEGGRRAEALLLRAEALEGAQTWAKANPTRVTESEREYLGRSQARRDEEAGQLRKQLVFTRTIGVLGVVAFAVAAGAIQLRCEAVQAKDEERHAKEEALEEQVKAKRATTEERVAKQEAQAAEQKARVALSMAGAGELLARRQGSAASLVVAGITKPEGLRGWPPLVLEVLREGIPTATYEHEDVVALAAWSSDGRRVVTVSGKGVARVWNADHTGQPVELTDRATPVAFAAWSPVAERIAVATTEGPLRILVEANGEWAVERELTGPGARVVSAAWSPDGQRLATASGSTVQVWSVDGRALATLADGKGGSIWSVAWSPDGTRIATGSETGIVRSWRADRDGRPIVLARHTARVSSVAWKPDGTRLASASFDGKVQVSSEDGTGEPRELHGDDAVNAVAWSPNGTRLVTAYDDGSVRVWKPDAMLLPLVVAHHHSGVVDAEWSPDGARIVTASRDGTARIWRARGPGTPFNDHEDVVQTAAWSPDGAHIVTASQDGTARVWSVGDHSTTVLDGEGSGSLARWSPDGKRIVTVSKDAGVRVWSLDGKRHVVVGRPEAHVGSVAWSPDGRRIVTSSNDAKVWVWGSDGAGPAIPLEGHQGPVSFATWSPDGERIVTASDDGTVRMWPADGKGEPSVHRAHEGAVTSVAWAPDGTPRVLTVQGQTARVWWLDGSRDPVVLQGHERRVTVAEWSPDGERIVTASEDKTARVWSADGTGDALRLLGHGDVVLSAGWSPDGEHIVTSSVDGTARVWPVTTQALKRALAAEASTDCLSIDQRKDYLGEAEADARTRHEGCERRHGRTP